MKFQKGESVETKFDNDRSSPSEDPSELENFNSLTEKELISTFGDALMGGKKPLSEILPVAVRFIFDILDHLWTKNSDSFILTIYLS